MKKSVLVFKLFLGTCLSLLLANSLRAQDNTIYEIEIPITKTISNPLENQTECLQDAFKAMVKKASGSTKVFEKEAFKKSLKEVDNYVEQFSYIQPNTANSRLKVKFNSRLMNNFFRETEIVVLENRPLTLLWWIIEQDKKPEWLLKESHNEISNGLEKLAQERNLPLIYPLLDLNDTTIVNENMVINQEFDGLISAGKRYNAEKIWVGRLTKQPSGWYGQWTLLGENKEENQNWDLSSETLEGLLAEALNTFAHRLQPDSLILAESSSKDFTEKSEKNKTYSKADAGSKNSMNKLRLKIADVLGLDSYAKVMNYLNALPLVKEVEVASVTSEGTIFDIKTGQTIEDLKKTIHSASFLMEINPSNNTKETSEISNKEISSVDLTYKMKD